MANRIAIVHSAPAGPTGRHWGDTHFAASLAAAVTRAGVDARVFAHDEREGATRMPCVVVRGLFAHLPAPNVPSVLWVISHSDLVTDEELAAFDHVCVASSREADRLAERTETSVHVLHQATDTTRFHPPGTRPVVAASGVVVVANNRWPGRRAPRWLRQLGIDFGLYGLKWGGTPEERFVVAPRVPNEHLAGIYGTADIVVADQWSQMARDGFVANRLFDVAAAGGFVVSDDGPGVQEVFGGVVPTYRNRTELGEQMDRWISDKHSRRRTAAALHELVRGAHTFDHRARVLLGLLEA